MESKQIQQTSEYRKKAADSQIKLVVNNGEEGRGSTGMGGWKVHITGLRQATRMHCTMQGIQPVFCKNCKWNITFKNCFKKVKIQKTKTQ